MKQFVCTSSEIKIGVIFEKKIEDKELIFVRIQNEIKAYTGICPHQGAKLSNGIIENDAIVCPLHHRAYTCKNGYDIKTHTVLASYPVVIEGEEVYVEFVSEHAVLPSGCTRSMADLPQPKGKFIVGNLPEFKAGNKPTVLEKWGKECGPIFKISLMGKKFIVSSDPNFNIQLYKNRPDKFRRFGKIGEVMSEMGIDGVFNVEGEQWKQHRKITAEALNARNVKGFFPVIQDVTVRLMHRWNARLHTDFIVDIQKEMMRYTVDVTTRIAFGYDVNLLQQDDDVLQQQLENIFPMINKRITSPIPFWRIIKSKEDKALDKALKSLEGTIVGFIQEAKNALQINPSLKEKPQNFLQALLIEKEKTGLFTDHEIYGNVFIVLLAGEDTTSNSISWALYYLAQHPHVFAKLRAEADAVLNNDDVLNDIDGFMSLKYTEAVAMETLRIKPVTPTLFLESLEDQVVNGLKIKKGVTVMMQSKVAQTSDAHFSNAEAFIPERWLSDSTMERHNTDAFRTFGAGPRFCPGKNLALHEMKMALSMIAKNFDPTLAVKPEDVKERFAFTLFPENLMLRIRKRV
jgi:cytochrome P450/nitrite reductase/ring-hydroxylating ferredoxin subunit